MKDDYEKFLRLPRKTVISFLGANIIKLQKNHPLILSARRNSPEATCGYGSLALIPSRRSAGCVDMGLLCASVVARPKGHAE